MVLLLLWKVRFACADVTTSLKSKSHVTFTDRRIAMYCYQGNTLFPDAKEKSTSKIDSFKEVLQLHRIWIS